MKYMQMFKNFLERKFPPFKEEVDEVVNLGLNLYADQTAGNGLILP